MSRALKLPLIALILVLAGCAQPGQEATFPPTVTELPQETTVPTTPPQEPTATLAPPASETAQPTQAEPTQPPPPTADINQLLTGNPLPLLPASSDLTLQRIQMITGQEGWAVSQVEGQGDHILITSTGGRSWQDVSPPQPLPESGAYLSISAGFADAQTAFVHYNGTELVWTTYNGGVTWQPSALTYQSMMGGLFAVSDADHAWLFQFLDAGVGNQYTAIIRTVDSGETWELVLDPTMQSTIQGLYKTGASFINSRYGWLTRDFSVAAYLYLDVTNDGGTTWDQIELPAPAEDDDIITDPYCWCSLVDPDLIGIERGSVRMECKCDNDQGQVTKNFLYKTDDGGESWTIYYIPEGTLHTVSDQVRYLTAGEIYRSTDGGEEWDFVKSVNWQGQFSFLDADLAFAIAYDPVDDEYALVKTTDGCQTFQIIEPVLEASSAVR